MDVLGRDNELARIDAWLDEASPGRGPLLLIEGEPGIGKTTLWAHAVARARALEQRVLSCRPVPSDAGLSHVGLTDLLSDVADEAFDALAPPQRRALRVALLREEAGTGVLDPRAVSTGLTALLGPVGAGRPLLVAIDDAQWLDPASARSLAFAVRRLAGRLAVLAAIRLEGPAGQHGGGFAAIDAAVGQEEGLRLRVGPLSVAATHQLFHQALGGSFPRPLLVSIHRAAGGNPFYSLEIARELNRAGNVLPGRPLPIPGNQRDLALLRQRRLPRATRVVLAEMAAMSSASASDVDLAALAPAERAGIVAVRPGGRVEFTHPLFGSALYSSLPEATRRDLHRRLAGRAASLEERARHLALAAGGPDEATASELDLAAAAASARGAADVAVELKELACRLTPSADRTARIRRGIDLADRRYFAGDPAGARAELERTVELLPDSEASDDRAEILLELGSIRWVQGDADAGRKLMTRALQQARTQAMRAQIHARIAAGADDADLALEHAEAAVALLDEGTDPVRYSYALHATAMFRLHAGAGADHAAVEKGMRLQREATGWDVSPVAAFWAKYFDDFSTARERLTGLIERFREQGDEAQVTGALTHLAGIEAMTGNIDRARALADEAVELAAETEQEAYLAIALCAQAQVRVHSGELEPAAATATELLSQLAAHPDVVLEAQARAVLGQVALTAGDLAEADRQLSRADEITTELVHNREPANQRFQADHAEAVIGLGDLPRAEDLVRRLEARAAALPRPWILAVSARCRGLLNAAAGDLDAALADFQRALAAHEALDMPSELGRTLLALGRLHRRRNERQQARQVLERAIAVLEPAGALGWAAIARDDLARARGRRAASPGRLTATERAVCELATAGLRNHEIAARMFLSEKTVEANLSRAYRKLAVRSRTELGAAMARADPGPARPGADPLAARRREP